MGGTPSSSALTQRTERSRGDWESMWRHRRSPQVAHSTEDLIQSVRISGTCWLCGQTHYKEMGRIGENHPLLQTLYRHATFHNFLSQYRGPPGPNLCKWFQILLYERYHVKIRSLLPSPPFCGSVPGRDPQDFVPSVLYIIICNQDLGISSSIAVMQPLWSGNWHS